METTSIANSTVAEIVANDYRTAEIFKKYGIDFCCGGKKTIAKVCSEKAIDAAMLEAELNSIQAEPIDAQHNFKEWRLSFLADYIETVHHTYVNNNLALISEFADKVAKVHGHHNTETVEINELWKQVVAELTVHMKKEELVLFPYIRSIEKFSRGETDTMPQPHFGTVKNPVRMMEHEHDVAGELMHRIAALSGNYTTPEYACNTYRVLYAKLNEFEQDLHHHIHLENNILFPRAIELEEQLLKK
jgi:regulator of cell morphogenesis and NO signaling